MAPGTPDTVPSELHTVPANRGGHVRRTSVSVHDSKNIVWQSEIVVNRCVLLLGRTGVYHH